MTLPFFNKFESIVVGTGNILENEEFKKAKNPTQEVNGSTKIDGNVKFHKFFERRDKKFLIARPG